MTNLPDDVGRDVVTTAFDIVEMFRASGGNAPEQAPASYRRLLDLTAKHGVPALGLVWLVWGHMIAMGLAESGTPDAALYAKLDGDPDLVYARRAVVLARQDDGEGMAELLMSLIRDQDRKRTGADIEGTSALLAMGAAQYGTATDPDRTH